MAPVVKAFEANPMFQNRVCVSAQHRQMLDQVVSFFDLRVDHDLDLMSDSQGLTDTTTRVLKGLQPILDLEKPDLLLVHGDTNTAMSAALAAFYNQIPVGHVEAGLRTYDLYSPWPEEAYRQIVDRLSALCFAPTKRSANNLEREHIVGAKTVITGNTVIDALLMAREKINSSAHLLKSLEEEFSFINDSRRLILVTGHRRESFGTGFQDICSGLAALAKRPDVEILYPVHLNPNVRGPVHDLLGGLDNVHLIEPQDYHRFVYLMDRCDVILTDSGGIQEEAPSLGKPVLVMRNNTERPEAVEAGTVILVGTDPGAIEQETSRLLDDAAHYERMAAAHNPYGNGTAAQHIMEAVQREYIQ